MKLLRQLLTILVISFIGELINILFNLPIPGSVIGMVILFVALYTGVIKLEIIKDISKFLIDHLAFFFLPAGVGLIASFSVLKEAWIPIISISLVTTVLVTVVTGYTVQLLKRGIGK